MKVEFEVRIESENEAFQGGEAVTELQNILGKLIASLEERVGSGPDFHCGGLRDANGNHVGVWSLELSDDEDDLTGEK